MRKQRIAEESEESRSKLKLKLKLKFVWKIRKSDLGGLRVLRRGRRSSKIVLRQAACSYTEEGKSTGLYHFEIEDRPSQGS